MIVHFSIITEILTMLDNDQFQDGMFNDIRKKHGISNDWNMIGNELLLMNLRSVASEYQNPNVNALLEKYTDNPIQFHPSKGKKVTAQTYKCLECLIRNSVQEKHSTLYAFITEVWHELAHQLICKTADYIAAQWGSIDNAQLWERPFPR